MPRNPKDKCDTTWEEKYGTDLNGNLPQHKTKECVDDVIDLITIQSTFPWVSLADFHYHHFKCPYSIESNVHFIKDTDRNSFTYWQNKNVFTEAAAHVATGGLMIRFNRGSKYGWLCVDPECPYYKGTVSGSTGGIPYFYY